MYGVKGLKGRRWECLAGVCCSTPPSLYLRDGGAHGVRVSSYFNYRGIRTCVLSSSEVSEHSSTTLILDDLINFVVMKEPASWMFHPSISIHGLSQAVDIAITLRKKQ